MCSGFLTALGLVLIELDEHQGLVLIELDEHQE